MRDNSSLLKIYLILNAIVLVVLGYLWNVTGKLLGYAIGNPEAWIGFMLLAAALYGLYYWSTYRNNREFELSEYILSIGGTLIPYFSMFTIFMGTTTGLSDKCLINTYIQKIIYIESYYTESSTEVCSGSGEDRKCRTVTKCDVYHGPQWYILAGSNHRIDISSGEYKNIKKHFGTPENQTASSQPFQCSGDGDQFEVNWAGDVATRIPCSYKELYINYVKATASLHKTTGQQIIATSSYPSLHSTPFGNIGVMRVVGDNIQDKQWANTVDQLLDHELTWLGKRRQCNILVYLTAQPQSFFGTLKEQWIGGKKNDIVVVLGKDWVRIMCWAKDANFEVKLRDKLLNETNINDPQQFVQTLISEIDHPDHGFQRKPMEEFRYLLSEVEMTWWAWLLILLITCAIISPMILHFHSN